jgi:hypothetical protein
MVISLEHSTLHLINQLDLQLKWYRDNGFLDLV